MDEFEIYLTKLGKAIKKQRNFRQLTQEDLLDRVHSIELNSTKKRQLAQETLSRIENGHFNSSVKQLYLISKALDITPADLLFLSQNIEI